MGQPRKYKSSYVKMSKPNDTEGEKIFADFTWEKKNEKKLRNATKMWERAYSENKVVQGNGNTLCVKYPNRTGPEFKFEPKGLRVTVKHIASEFVLYEIGGYGYKYKRNFIVDGDKIKFTTKEIADF